MLVLDRLTDEEALQDAREGLNFLRLEMNGNLPAQLAIFQINELLDLFERKIIPKKPRGWQHAWGLFDKRAKPKPVDQKK